MLQSFMFETKKRKRVSKGLRDLILKAQGGKCKRCGKSIRRKGVRPILHHKNLNPKDNRPSNLVVVCPDCHDKIHQKERKVRKKVISSWGVPEYRVVKIKNKTKKKTKKRKKKKRKKKYSLLDTQGLGTRSWDKIEF